MNHKPTPMLEKMVPEAEDFLPLLGTDHIELYCGNAKQSAYYYMTAWGYKPCLLYTSPSPRDRG